MFSFLYHCQDFYWNCLPVASTWVQPRFFCGVRVVHLFIFLCPIMCLYVLSFALWCPLRFPHQNDVRFIFTSSCLYEGSCLFLMLFVLACGELCPTHIVLCFSVSSMLPVSPDCPFLIAPSVFCSVYFGTVNFNNKYL